MIVDEYSSKNRNILIKSYRMLPKKIRLFIKKQKYKMNVTQYINKWGSMEHTLIFKSIEIETINRCNGECPFCPVNKFEEQRKFAKMREELFVSIIDQLADIQFDGNVSLFSNNEPFLDERIIDFAKITRKRLPNCTLQLYTNGTLLTLEKFKMIIPYLDKLVIDNYNDHLTLNKTSKIINQYCQKHEGVNSKVEIHLRKIHEVLTSRGGQAPNKKTGKGLNFSCFLPYQQVIVRPDGKLSLCSNDALGKYTLGDLTRETLMEAWQSETYQRVRQKLRYNRKRLKLCRNCDTCILG